MKAVFIGTVDFSRHCLREMLRLGTEVTDVFTLAREDAGFNSDYADLRPVAGAYDVPVHHVKDVNAAEHVEAIRAAAPDVIFVLGWSRLVSNEILDLPAFGCIGSHPAPLPQGRGRHPLVWTLVKELEEGALTFFYLGEKADDGDILWQRAFPVTPRDDAATLYAKAETCATEGLRAFLPQLEAGEAPRRPQNDAEATHWPKRGYADGQIDWRAPAAETYNLVRALTRPYVGAHTRLGGEDVKVWRAARVEGALPEAAAALAPGTVFEAGGGRFDVRTGDGRLRVTDYEAPPALAIAGGTQFDC